MLTPWSETAFYLDGELIDSNVVYRWVKAVKGDEVHRRAPYGSFFQNVAMCLYHNVQLEVTEEQIRDRWRRYKADSRTR